MRVLTIENGTGFDQAMQGKTARSAFRRIACQGSGRSPRGFLSLWAFKLLTVCSLLVVPGTLRGQFIIKSEFDKEHPVSRAEVAQVKAFAQEAGLASPANVSPIPILPSSNYLVRVSNIERTNGRMIKFETVDVYKSNWSGGISSPGAKHKGDYWIERPYIRSNHFVLFVIRGVTNRVQLYSDLSIETVDRVLSNLANRTVAYSPPGASSNLKNIFNTIDVIRPGALSHSKQDDTYMVNYGLYVVFVKESQGKWTILGVEQIQIPIP